MSAMSACHTILTDVSEVNKSDRFNKDVSERKMDVAGDKHSIKVMWQPNPNSVTRMDEFRLRVNEKFNLKLSE